MKTKFLLMVSGALVLTGALWLGRAAWRAHRQLVTLDVRNAPLAEVLRKIEWQTWTKLRAENKLDARITLHVTDKPLSYVLDRLAEQAGARWSALYAVYDSAARLKALDAALRGDGKIEPAAWTQIAPNPAVPGEPEPQGTGFFRRNLTPESSGQIADGTAPQFDRSQGGEPPLSRSPEFKGAPPRWMGEGPKPDGSGPMAGRHGPTMFSRAGNGSMIMQNASGEIEVWSPEQLVLESSLTNRLVGGQSETATTAAAADVARRVNGRWTTYLAFRKSNMGMGFSGPPPGRPGVDPLHQPPNPNDRFAKFTPEQRVRRARERSNFDHQ